ncbi:MAG: tRNA (guanosine(37)-N1)-methyltransferase TrmD [Candidatus Krumholzibacteriia bacterium]
MPTGERPAVRVLTLFPEMVRTVLDTSILGRARRQGLVEYQVVDIREFAVDRHGTVDGTAAGGGAGMIMMAPPVVEAVEWCRRRDDAPVLLTSPQGARLDEDLVLELRDELQRRGELILICGHYKGVDERVRELVVTREVSIGDYVLSGGELAALVIVDAVVRRLPGVLHDEDSAESDSFTDRRDGGLDCPWYTRPTEYRGLAIPEVLLSGHHANIETWRAEEARRRTRQRRPDLDQGPDAGAELTDTGGPARPDPDRQG